jgi:bacillithiol system protein YtxJ
MDWINLEKELQLNEIIEQSRLQPVVIFKHSTRCSISAMAMNRLDRANNVDTITWYYLDLIAHRNISNRIAETFSVAHESPQILLIKNGECIYEESHNGIDVLEIIEQAS